MKNHTNSEAPEWIRRLEILVNDTMLPWDALGQIALEELPQLQVLDRTNRPDKFLACCEIEGVIWTLVWEAGNVSPYWVEIDTKEDPLGAIVSIMIYEVVAGREVPNLREIVGH